MRGVGRIIRAAESRIEIRYGEFVRSVFLDPYLPDTAGNAAHLRQVLEQLGLSMIRTFKIRPDGRGVHLVRNDEGDERVLKTWYTPGRTDRGLAQMYRANALRAAGYSLFPEVYEARPGYTLEAYVSGPLLGNCPEQEVDEQAVPDLLKDLKHWSRDFGETHAVVPEKYLESFEVADRCRDMIWRAFRHTQYRSRRRIPRYMYEFHKRRGVLRDSIRELMDMAERILIPRYVSCGDMHPANLVLERLSKRFMIVDYEEMNDGHYGFDMANLSSQVYRLGLTSRVSEPLAAHLEDPDFMEHEDVSRFFRKLDRILKEILGVIFDVPDDGHSRP